MRPRSAEPANRDPGRAVRHLFSHVLDRLPEGTRRLALPLLLLGLAALGILVFAGIAEEVVEGDTHMLDRWLLLALREPGDPAAPIGPLWLEDAARDITALGSVTIVTIVTAVAVGYLVWVGKRHHAWLVAGSVIGGGLAMSLLKRGFDRPRPDLVAHAVKVYTASFPSGHAMLSAVVFLTLGVLLAETQERRRVGAYIIGIAIALTILVGSTRVYLGVHYPSDVLAGWFAGASWALLCWLLARHLRERGQLRNRP